ncbi:hypothetical protein BSR42_12080 [Megasphaera cerevisiae]|nr:hypothetical protein BSR42_12080 [Megasphaera cerevisiae]
MKTRRARFIESGPDACKLPYLESEGGLDSRIVPQAEVFTAVEGIPLADALGVKGIERFQEDVFGRDVAAADGEALDAVHVTIGDAFRTVAAEGGAVLEVFVVGEGIPAAGLVRIGLADVDAGHPEVGRTATGSAAEVKGGVARFMIFVDRMTIHITAKVRAVLAIIQGDRSLVADVPLRTDAKDVGQLIKGSDIIHIAVGRCKGVIVVAGGAQVPGHDAEVRREGMLRLDVGCPFDSWDRVFLQDRA